MGLHRLIEEFASRSRACRSAEDLFCLAESAARELGFRRFALVHGLWFRLPDRRLIRLDNFGEWADIFIERGYYRDDPALLACQRTNLAFAWTEIPELIPLGQRQIAILHEAGRHGLCTGDRTGRRSPRGDAPRKTARGVHRREGPYNLYGGDEAR